MSFGKASIPLKLNILQLQNKNSLNLDGYQLDEHSSSFKSVIRNTNKNTMYVKMHGNHMSKSARKQYNDPINQSNLPKKLTEQIFIILPHRLSKRQFSHQNNKKIKITQKSQNLQKNKFQSLSANRHLLPNIQSKLHERNFENKISSAQLHKSMNTSFIFTTDDSNHIFQNLKQKYLRMRYNQLNSIDKDENKKQKLRYNYKSEQQQVKHGNYLTIERTDLHNSSKDLLKTRLHDYKTILHEMPVKNLKSQSEINQFTIRSKNIVLEHTKFPNFISRKKYINPQNQVRNQSFKDLSPKSLNKSTILNQQDPIVECSPWQTEHNMQ